MNPSELRVARRQLQLSPEELATELRVSADSVRAWETGVAVIPVAVAEDVSWRAQMAEREEFARREGLNCEWLEEFRRTPSPRETEALLARLQDFKEHKKTCVKCQGREGKLVEQFGPAPDHPSYDRLVRAASARSGWFGAFNRLPRWAQYLVGTALFLSIFFVPRLLVKAALGRGGLLGLAVAAAVVSALLIVGILAPLPGGRVERAFRVLQRSLFLLVYLFAVWTASGKYGRTMEDTPSGTAIVGASALSGLLAGGYFRLNRRRLNPA